METQVDYFLNRVAQSVCSHFYIPELKFAPGQQIGGIHVQAYILHFKLMGSGRRKGIAEFNLF